MQWLPIISVLILVQYTVSKDTATYQVSGIEIVDLIRGFKPKGNMLTLTKVDGDPASYPDGIYFKPEDEALTGESKYLHYNVRNDLEFIYLKK